MFLQQGFRTNTQSFKKFLSIFYTEFFPSYLFDMFLHNSFVTDTMRHKVNF